MNDITRIVEKYKEMEINDIASSPSLARDIASLDKMSDKASAKERDDIKDVLNRIMSAINQEISRLESELDKHPAALEQIQKNAQACMAYTKAKGRKD